MVTDGELRRYAFFGHMIEALAGFDKQGGWAVPFRDERGEELIFKRPVVVDKLRWRRSMCGEEFAYLRGRATKPTKVTLISTQQAAAYYDPKFSAGQDAVSYSVPVSGTEGPFHIAVELLYQPIGFRWAHNLEPYTATEPQRFLRYYDSMSNAASTVLARTEAVR